MNIYCICIMLIQERNDNTSISFGNGPGEFLHIQQIQSSDSLLWLSDAQRPFISAYRKKDIYFQILYHQQQ